MVVLPFGLPHPLSTLMKFSVEKEDEGILAAMFEIFSSS